MTLAALTAGQGVVLCAGPGGVGKTTVAAALGLAAARQGRRVAVITIDPARRLADALGVALTNEPSLVAPNLWALMLDAQATFDGLIRRYAGGPVQAERILANRFYRNIASSLSGTQEYMATERLHELALEPADGQRFDLVVVDTPPTANALEFLTASERLHRFLDNRVFRLLMAPGRGSMRLVSGAAEALLRAVGKVVGGEVVADAVAFFRAFEGMEEGFRQRAAAVAELLRAPGTGWVVVSSARPESVSEAVALAEHLQHEGLRLTAAVANRVTPAVGPLPPADGGAPDGWPPELAAWLALAQRQAAHRARDQGALAPLAEVLTGNRSGPLVEVPLLPDDIHDLDGLARLADLL